MPDVEDRLIDDALWEEILELTGGAAAGCFQCGSCTATCPWGLVSDETFSVRALIRQAQLGLLDDAHDLWLCTTCSHCEASCPRGVDISAVILGLRQVAWHGRKSPPGFPSLLWSVYWNNNPWTQPPSHRSQWAKDLELFYFDPGTHELLLYIGCTSSYDRRAQMIAKAIVLLLQAAGVSFGILYDDEPCCGESVLSVGHSQYYQEVAQKAAQTLDDKGVRHLVTISPHCYHVFKNQNPFLKDQIKVSHYTVLLRDLIEQGKLKFNRRIDRSVTFHDPCYLARYNQHTVAPRSILQAIPGLDMVEMERNRSDTLCCGAGGGRMWLETEPGKRFSDLRVGEALGTGAGILATACPFCLTCLEDSIRGSRLSDMEVLDIAEIAALACE